MFALKCLLVFSAAFAAHGFNLGPADIQYHVYTRSNPTLSEPLLPTANSIMLSRYFSPTRRTVIIIHSHDDSVAGNFNAFMIPAYLGHSDVNCVAVDWSAGSEMYVNALGHAPQVGRSIAEFINILGNTFLYYAQNFSIVGVGLGAHIAGIAARNVNGIIPKIYAIDPALIGWTHHPDRLRPEDATDVEVLHATAGIFGYDYPLGTLDFYPNGGTYQTGCGTDSDCAHIYAYAFFAESLDAETNGGNKFVGTACESYEEAVAQTCSGERDLHFGGSEDKTGSSGIYWFATNPTPPFARG